MKNLSLLHKTPAAVRRKKNYTTFYRFRDTIYSPEKSRYTVFLKTFHQISIRKPFFLLTFISF